MGLKNDPVIHENHYLAIPQIYLLTPYVCPDCRLGTTAYDCNAVRFQALLLSQPRLCNEDVFLICYEHATESCLHKRNMFTGMDVNNVHINVYNF